MCARVNAACEEKTASSATICGGPDTEGCASAATRRRTTATEMTMLTQNPAFNHPLILPPRYSILYLTLHYVKLNMTARISPCGEEKSDSLQAALRFRKAPGLLRPQEA